MHAEITVLLGEPFGSFGAMMPVGHAAIYLDRVCADGPLRLRMCEIGEPQGVVIARYHRIGQIDWIATPVMQFFYATDDPKEIPAYATPEIAWAMRERYRRRYILEIVPDGNEKLKATDEWWETAGNAYNRRFWGYQIATTEEQDEAFVRTMNADSNHHSYRMNNNNCADFAANMVNLYFPGSVRRDRIADFGWMTPKQVARSVANFGKAHPEAHLRVIEVPQVPGSLKRSKPVRGASETALKSKRYLAALLVLQPEIVAVSAVLYLDHGRWTVGKEAETITAENLAKVPSTTVATGETEANKTNGDKRSMQ
ncbi:DUF4105 domain-containing protein [Granulicella sp. WH15]|uniref:DUF4105 domain-containing protein n=1 Tax=Granulicella sp. WH15 TaxID=2602070 RepID=UPI001366C2F7|nr:DUF4105 domain-containing protein [Granulicella sp. WH15]QHN04851.1 DUF4105 domain-containing protein [Granulicella sp. WH15]